jgi:magnesium transporter
VSFHKRVPPIGSRPGTLAIPADSPPPRIHVFDYSGEVCREAEIDDPEELRRYLGSEETAWVDVQGFGDEEKLRKLAAVFGLHDLTLADATNVPQRAKVEIQPGHLLVIARAPQPGADEIAVPQVCFIVGSNWVLSLQDQYFGFFDAVRERIRVGIGPIRDGGPDYLLYALLNVMVDHYLPRVEGLAHQLDAIEERVNEDPESSLLSELHQIRRALVVIRRVGWPQREALRALAVEPNPFIREQNLIFFRHAETHAIQIMEAVDSARDATTGLVEIYLSSVSQRTNEIMKVLTLMASIFIPLTFIAGIYGMNFENMPELHNQLGYPMVIAIMVMTAMGMLTYFWRRGWLGNRRNGRKDS